MRLYFNLPPTRFMFYNYFVAGNRDTYYFNITIQ
uniref:Uncharacterized protein n=1 Tax=Anguilla anguilla TaxID=7936 RepID=A0A0E9SNI3_ANGAN